MSILTVENLRVQIGTPHGLIEPVRGVSFDIEPGESVAIVGESGSGKTVTALSLMRLMPKKRTRITADRLDICGQDARSPSNAMMRQLRGRQVAMIFQDPMTSLNPVMKVGTQIAEAARRVEDTQTRAAKVRVLELLEAVDVDAVRVAGSYPHQLSGGMKQRAMIAMALACQPSLIIADEPTTALDVSTQAGVLELLAGLTDDFGAALLLVTHDMGVVAQVADRVLVMYGGTVVETAPTCEIFDHPRHPYTRGLLDSVPTMSDHRGHEFSTIPGSAPDATSVPDGCPFITRCSRRSHTCEERPGLTHAAGANAGHSFACWHPLEEVRV